MFVIHPNIRTTSFLSTHYVLSAGSGSAAGGRAAAVKKEDPAMKKKIYHIGASAYDISVYCDNIFIKDDIIESVMRKKQTSFEEKVSRIWKAFCETVVRWYDEPELMKMKVKENTDATPCISYGKEYEFLLQGYSGT